MTNAAQIAIEHAALNGHFAPRRFLYAAGDDTAQVLSALGPLCHEIVEDDKILWRMRNSDRLRVLKQLFRDKARLNQRLRKRGPKKSDTFAQVLAACLKGKTAPKIADFIVPDDPQSLHKLREALSATVVAQSVVSAKRGKSLVAFERKLRFTSSKYAERARQQAVLPSKLCGRIAERKAIFAFLNNRPVSHPITVLNPAAQTPPRSLLVLGSPGMGKSAFLADLSARLPDRSPRPWVLKFDFDQLTLLHGGSIAWTEEAMRQLSLQLRDKQDKLDDLRGRFAQRRAEEATGETLSEVEFLLDDTATILADVPHKPMVVLLDTIEEVVSRDMREDFERAPRGTVFRSLIDWVKRLSTLNGVQPVHVIYSGRIPPPIAQDLLPEWFDAELELPQLEDDAAAELLGIFDADMSHDIRTALVQSVGGHPLHLILVQKHLRNLTPSEREDVIEELQQEGLPGMESSTVMQTLYSRFLDRLRIKDRSHGLTEEMIKQLAHPGLLLRKITVETLTDVIAPAVGVDFSGAAAAQQAFRILRDQVWLVNSAPGSDFITHRPDVRRVMLPMMLGSTKPEIACVLKAAIKDRDAADDPVNAGYFRALLGETSWLKKNPELAQSVINKAGLEELEVLTPEVRGLLKFYASEVRPLSEEELSTLDDKQRDLAQFASSAEMVRKTGTRSSASAMERQSGSDREHYANRDMIDRLKEDIHSTGQSGDAYDILNHTFLQTEINTAFIEGDFETVLELGWHAIAQMRSLPDLSQPLAIRMSEFGEFWLWRLTLASMVMPVKEKGALTSLKRKISDWDYSISRTQTNNIFSASLFDFDMLLRSLDPRARPQYMLNGAERQGKVSNLGFKGQRLLAQSILLRSVAKDRSVTLEVSANTQSFLAPEYRQLARGDDASRSVMVDYRSARSKSAELVEDIFKHIRRGRQSGPDELTRIYRGFVRSRRIDRSNAVPLTYLPIGDVPFPRTILNRVVRGQTPELHDTVAGLLVNEIVTDSVEDLFFFAPLSLPTPWPQDALRRIQLLSNPKANSQERHDAAIELTRFADLCGLLTMLAGNMAEQSSSPRVQNVARLLRHLDHHWTWPTKT